jgi:alginate O-acetyltransferase complex protein AlgI
MTCSILLIGLFIYSFQIYFDFYGYSSIAIASARLFGVNVIPNFNHPYLASSLVGFWQKWHISLSSWLRDYVYLPIAYKMKPIFSFSIAILLVFIVSGAWHGMTMNYLVWGAIHGTLIVVGQLTKKRRHQIWKNTLKGRLSRVRHTLQIVWVFLLVSLAWVFFVVPQLKNAFNVLTRIIIWDHGSISNSVGNILFRPEFAAYILCVIIFFTIDSLGVVTSVVESVPESKKKIFRELLLINSFIVLIILFGDIGTQNFIYLRF